MNSAEIFSIALNLQSPWKITDVRIEDEGAGKELHIDLGYDRGTKFENDEGKMVTPHDTQKRTWRHLNFFEHKAYLHSHVPRVKGKNGIHLVPVPWARAHSGFTLLFEGYVMALIESEMPVRKVGKLLNEDSHRMWTIFNYWIKRAYNADDPKGIKQLGVDETSVRKGHNYVTLGVDLEERRVVHVTSGKDKKTLKNIGDYLESKGVNLEDIKDISMDLSRAFISGAMEYFSKAEIHFDRFHVVKLLNQAMDTVRKQERKEHDELKGEKYLFLQNRKKLKREKEARLVEYLKLYPTLGEAYRLKELFNDLWEQETAEAAREFLEGWFEEVEQAKIPAFQSFAKTVRAHLSGIVNFCQNRISNGVLEGINNKVQLAKRRARGYARTENFINMIYFLCGKLKFDYPLFSS